MGIVSWIILGALVGQAVHTWGRDRFPGGFAGRLAAGTAGGFLGGGTFTLATGRGTSRVDAAALALAVIGAVVILLAARGAGLCGAGPALGATAPGSEARRRTPWAAPGTGADR